MWKDSLSRVLCIALGTVMVSSPTIWSQEVPSVKRFRGGGRLFFKRVEVGASKVIRLSFEGMAEEDLIVIRSRGREMQIVGGVYHGPRIRRGALTPNAPLESLFPLQYAPLPEEVVHVNGTHGIQASGYVVGDRLLRHFGAGKGSGTSGGQWSFASRCPGK